jgi:hypothetical protein
MGKTPRQALDPKFRGWSGEPHETRHPAEASETTVVHSSTEALWKRRISFQPLLFAYFARVRGLFQLRFIPTAFLGLIFCVKQILRPRQQLAV